VAESDYAGGAMAEQVAALVLPILADLGLELYDCEHAGGIVRVTVSRPAHAADQGLDLDVIALVTRLLSRELDHADPFPGRYTLEVTSPGLERVLRRPSHYHSAIGQLIAVRLVAPVDGTRRLQGTLVAADEHGIRLRLEDVALTEHRLGYGQIERARTVFVWGPTPKPGKPAGKRPAARAATPDPTTQEAGAS